MEFCCSAHKAYGDLARYIARRYRDITYKLVYKSMYSNQEMCIIAYEVIIKCVALLESPIEAE